MTAAVAVIDDADNLDTPTEGMAPAVPDRTYEMAQAVLALDEWMAKGGFPPDIFRDATSVGVEKRLNALSSIRRLLSAPEWPGASGLEDISEIVERATGPIPNDPTVTWGRH